MPDEAVSSAVTVAEQTAFGFIEYGLAGLMLLVLLTAYGATQYYARKDRLAKQLREEAREEKRAETANTVLREKDATIREVLTQRHDDSVAIEKRLARLEGKVKVED